MALFVCDVPCYFRKSFFEKGMKLETADDEESMQVPWPFKLIEGTDPRPEELKVRPKPKTKREVIEKQIKKLQDELVDEPQPTPKIEQPPPPPAHTQENLAPTNAQLKQRLDDLGIKYGIQPNKAALLDLMPQGETITLTDGSTWTKQ